MRVVTLNDKMPWFGRRTGYELLPEYLAEHWKVRQITPQAGLLPRLLGKVVSCSRGYPPRGQSAAWAEYRFTRAAKQSAGTVAHILYGEHHLGFVTRRKDWPQPLCATLHLPRRKWDCAALHGIAQLDAAIVLFRGGLAQFQGDATGCPLHFIPHGVDVEFFRPAPARRKPEQRLLFSGVYLRNTAMLSRVVTGLVKSHPLLHFDFLVPLHARDNRDFDALREHPAVTWHAGLGDEELRNLYQASCLMLLPMEDSGANTAVVEALASGLPIVTTDVGGIRDYGGGNIFPVIQNNDHSAMIELVERYLRELTLRDDIATQCRRFAEEVLAWPLVARRHAELYASLLKRS